MPLYCFKCLACGTKIEKVCDYRDTVSCECGVPMVRDFRAENVANTFRPSVDLYAIKKRQDAKRSGT